MYGDREKLVVSTGPGPNSCILYLQSCYCLYYHKCTQVNLESLFGLTLFLFTGDRSKNKEKIFASEVSGGCVSGGVPSGYLEGAMEEVGCV